MGQDGQVVGISGEEGTLERGRRVEVTAEGRRVGDRRGGHGGHNTY